MIRPASFPWLLRHELRLAFRTGGGRRRLWSRALLLLIVAAVPIGIGVLGALALRDLGGGAPGRGTILIVTFAIAAVMLTMAPAAAVGVLRTFHERADLDLLLSAPVPAARVLAAKSAGSVLAVALPLLILAGPFLLISAAIVRPGLLGGIVVLLVLAVLVTSAAFVVTRLLRRWLGARRARVIVQVGGGLVGAAIFLAFQLPSIAPGNFESLGARLAGWTVPPGLDWPARAALGEAGPLLAVVLLAAAAGRAALRFAAGVLFEAPDTAGARRPVSDAAPMFRSGLMRAVLSKEGRLLARDPELLAQIMLRLVFLVPALALVLRGGGEGGARVAGAAAALAGFLASSLAWLTVAAEDAPDLLRSAPVPATAVLRAKLLAACAPPFALAAAAAAFAASLSWWAGLVALVAAALSASSAAYLQAYYAKPTPRAAFRKRQRGGVLLGVAEIAMVGGWSAFAALLAQGSPLALFPGILAAGLFYAAVDARPRAPA